MIANPLKIKKYSNTQFWWSKTSDKDCQEHRVLLLEHRVHYLLFPWIAQRQALVKICHGFMCTYSVSINNGLNTSQRGEVFISVLEREDHHVLMWQWSRLLMFGFSVKLLMIVYVSRIRMCIGNRNECFISLRAGNLQITLLVWNIGSAVLTVWLITAAAYGVK